MNIKNPERTCPECGKAFTATHGRQVFCTPAHKAAFHNRQMARGKVAMSLLQTWRWRTRDVDADLASYAHTELCNLAAEWNREDKAEGRMPYLVVQQKMDLGWRACDL